MDVFDFAMKMEQDGEAYYRKLAAEANNRGLTSILTFLADEEVKHYNIFKKLKEGTVSELPESTLLADVKNVFQEISEMSEGPFHFDVTQPQFYRKAQDIEKQSEMFYRDKAEETENENEQKLMLKIADEEKRHYNVLENIIDFVQHPQQWIEDAEWNKLGEG